MDGIINVYKPKGKTSHDVVGFLRKKCNMKKIGHTGTLDPIAQGVLPVCIGKATRLSNYLLEKDKRYIAEMQLGVRTDTYDLEGTVLERRTPIPVSQEIFDEVARNFIGTISQKPPIYSAIKIKGKKLYQYAREGIEIEVPNREVTVSDIRYLASTEDRVTFEVSCSKGTYVRSLIEDLGNILGCGASMSNLIRTKSGTFDQTTAHTLDEIEAMDQEEIEKILIPMDAPLVDYPPINVKTASKRFLLNGVVLLEKNVETLPFPKEDTIVRLYCEKQFHGMGVIRLKDGQKTIKPTFIYKEFANGNI
ncbi:MAG TPA: tRNA pseudouridine(55) synthase TruB [Eubacteriaceae bacterium]|nr:tRNA pseudouridine(55) synthase TruB [Eubacteriaceae bacterium]